ncbi:MULTISPECIES: FxSxx-COOH cyclophane-containing RiPP peptide [unclassified Actinomadura]|uniref:FxSxx-COOH cyclophane-containing RiPP peptide n=1 Tax=unclassified Actinomadura TaxID=2626254 RepID=UPI0011EE47E4|nr:FxSxx-COOH cyclophane-containing RiPP peptide [Actinomadura sp. K4S16]
MPDAGADSPDLLLDVSAIPLHALDDLEDSVLAHALERFFVSLDTNSSDAVAAFQSAFEDDME